MLSDFVDKAVNETPPFEKSDKGFGDALILESYIEYININSLDDVFFLTNDQIFFYKEVKKVFMIDAQN